MHNLLRLWDAMPHRVFSVSNRFDRIDSSFRGVTLLIFGISRSESPKIEASKGESSAQENCCERALAVSVPIAQQQQWPSLQPKLPLPKNCRR